MVGFCSLPPFLLNEQPSVAGKRVTLRKRNWSVVVILPHISLGELHTNHKSKNYQIKLFTYIHSYQKASEKSCKVPFCKNIPEKMPRS